MFFGWKQPDAVTTEEQAQAERSAAYNDLRRSGDLPMLGLQLGLNMMANSETQGLGQALGNAGLSAMRDYQSVMDARKRSQDNAKRRELLDVQMNGMKAQQAEAERITDLKKRFASGDRSDDVMNGLYGDELLKRQWAQEDADRNMRQQMALASYRHGLSASAPDKGQYDSKLGGFVHADGSFTPVRLPDGYQPPTSEGFEKIDAGARKELSDLSGLDAAVKYIDDAVEAAYPKKGEKKGGTGVFVGAMPSAVSSRLDPEGVPLRAAISNFSSQLMNALSGAAVSEQEKIRLEGFLPTASDTESTLRQKIAGYKDYIRQKATGFQNVYGPHRAFGRMHSLGGVPPLPPGFVETGGER